MIFTLLEITSGVGFWTLSKVWSLGRWVIYGREEDPKDKFIREQQKIIQEYQVQLEQWKTHSELLQEYVVISTNELGSSETTLSLETRSLETKEEKL